METTSRKPIMRLDAHRGNSRYFPENTMTSFRSAMEIEIDMMETDVHMTKDGAIVLMHDADVKRTTNGAGLIRDMTLAEIRKLDAGSWKGEEFTGEKVPTFEEFLDLAKTRKDLTYIIELKDYPGEEGERALESADKIISMIEEFGMAEHVILNSWSGDLMEYIDNKYDHKYVMEGYYPLHLMGNKMKKDPFSYLPCFCLFGQQEIMPAQADFDEVIGHGAEAWVYFGEEDKELYRTAIERGAVLVTANDPKKAHEVLKELGAR